MLGSGFQCTVSSEFQRGMAMLISANRYTGFVREKGNFAFLEVHPYNELELKPPTQARSR